MTAAEIGEDYTDRAGNSNWTLQAFSGVGYRFDWGSMVLGFRNLSYDMSAGKPVQNMRLTGAILTSTGAGEAPTIPRRLA
jgi:hypothetical protein